jgi:hypothetical protein
LKTLTDKKSGLEFVRIPKGQYPELLSLSEKQLEKTQNRKVTVGPIWVGITDVTVAAYEKCAKGKACSMDTAARDEPMNRCAWKEWSVVAPDQLHNLERGCCFLHMGRRTAAYAHRMGVCSYKRKSGQKLSVGRIAARWLACKLL